MTKLARAVRAAIREAILHEGNTDVQAITEDDKAMTDQELRARLDEMTLEHALNDRLREKQIEELKRIAEDTRKELSRMPWVIVSLIAALVVIGGAAGGVLSFLFDK